MSPIPSTRAYHGTRGVAPFRRDPQLLCEARRLRAPQTSSDRGHQHLPKELPRWVHPFRIRSPGQQRLRCPDASETILLRAGRHRCRPSGRDSGRQPGEGHRDQDPTGAELGQATSNRRRNAPSRFKRSAGYAEKARPSLVDDQPLGGRLICTGGGGCSLEPAMHQRPGQIEKDYAMGALDCDQRRP
jgi:hypothetical protein